MILCVEDDKDIRNLIIYALKGQGFEVMGFESGEELFDFLKDNQLNPSLFLLDIMLPGMDGIEILKILQQDRNYISVPTIMLTAKGGEYDKINGLDSGADDYITKPFSVLEMVARVKAAMRRKDKNQAPLTSDKPSKDIISIGSLSVDSLSRKVMLDGNEVYLTYKEYELLKILIEHKGIVMSRERLLNDVWGFCYEGETRTVDVHVASLRQKLGSFSKNIITIRNVGYKVELEK